MRTLTCRIPFTTTGLAFSVNDLYYRFIQGSSPEACTIHQFYRYTLMQFELKCYKVQQKQPVLYPRVENFIIFDRNLSKIIENIDAYKKNFSNIVKITNSYGHFQENAQNFCTIVSPTAVHSPHTVRISNLRSIVTALAAGCDLEFMNENTLPGAIFNSNGALLNGDSIMPSDYNLSSFQEDASAVLATLDKLDPQVNGISITECDFSHKGHPASLVSTNLEQGIRDRIPPILQPVLHEGESILSNITEIAKIAPDYSRFTASSERIWYSIFPLKLECNMDNGILTYCGVWSEKLAKKWPDISVRYPASSKELDVGAWSSIFNSKMNEKKSGELDYYYYE